MRALVLGAVLLSIAGCGLSRYREDRDALLRELREGPVAPYAAGVGQSPAPPAPPEAVEKALVSEGLELDEALAYALSHNPALVSALAHWEMLIERVPQVSSFDDPMLQYVEHLRSVQTRSGPMERGVMLSQRIPWPEKVTLRGEMAIEDSRKASQEYRGRILAVVEEVEHAYFEYALVHDYIRINEELKRLMTEFQEVARRKLEAGQASQPDVLRAQIQFIHLEHHGIVLERDRRIAAEKLNALMNRPPRSSLGIPDRPEKPAFDEELPALLSRAETASPDLRATEHGLSRATARRTLAGREYIPDLTVGASYTQIEGGTNPMFDKDGDDAVALTLGINLPLQFGRRSAAVSEAEAEIRKARADYLGVKRRIERDVSIAFERLVELRHESMLLGETLLPQTEQHLAAARKAYEAGTLDFLTLIDAEKNIEGIRRDQARVTAEFHRAKATLKRAVGGTLK